MRFRQLPVWVPGAHKLLEQEGLHLMQLQRTAVLAAARLVAIVGLQHEIVARTAAGVPNFWLQGRFRIAQDHFYAGLRRLL
jgi:hypothetical protein